MNRKIVNKKNEWKNCIYLLPEINCENRNTSSGGIFGYKHKRNSLNYKNNAFLPSFKI